ncbi:MAG: hypothetical protein K5778_04405 [Bacteroidaceae bacterium]|nr:hypothetical protein [Bacteroidaceae bacterium]
MKKSLLLLGAALLMTASAMAQTYTNTRSKAAPPAFSDPNSYNYAAAEGGDTLYLWNVMYGGFYANHRDEAHHDNWPYMTRASVNDTIGSKVIFTRINPAGGDTQAEDDAFFNENPDAYLLVSYVSKFGDYRCTFVDWFDGIWTDNNTTNNRYLVPFVAGNYLRIHPTGNIRNELPADWDTYNFCVRGADVDPWRCVFFNLPEYEEVNTETGETTKIGIPTTEEVGEDWGIVSPTVYDVWIVNAKEQNTLYALGNQLADVLNKAVADTDDGIRPMLDTQIQILNDASSTAEQLQGAIDAIPDIIVEYKASTVTPDNPGNFTSKIINPDFTGGNLSGWSGSGWGRAGVVDDAAERYHMNFDTYQDINDLPVGVYKVVVDGFCRSGEAQEDYNAMKAGTIPNPKLYVGCTTFGEFETSMHHASDAALTSDPGYDNSSSVIWEGTTYFIPNSMKAFVGYVTDSKTLGLGDRPYGIAAYGALAEGEALRIGARDTNGGNDWVIVDNFELWYLGNTLAAYLKWAEGAAASLPTFNWDEIYYGAPDKAFYDAVKNNLTNATTKEDVMDAVKNVGLAADTIAASVEIYNRFVAEVTGFDQWTAESGVGDSEYLEKLELYMDKTEIDGPSDDYPNGTAAYILDYYNGAHAGTLSVEEMKAELEFIQQMKNDALEHGMTKNTDLSHLIQNPRFEGLNGGQVPNWTADGGLTATRVPQAEFFNHNFDFYQDINSDVIMPGLYEVSVQAFYRTASNANAWAAYQADPAMQGEAKVHTYVYLNEFATPVKNVMEIAFDSNLANNCYSRSDGKYTLDGMASAAVAFAYPEEERNFTQHTYGLVTEEEAGHIRLGIRNQTGKNDARWTLFGNFGFRYMGKDAEGLKQVIQNYLDREDNLDLLEVLDGDYETWAGEMDATAGYEEIEGDANGDSDELFQMLIRLVKAYNDVANSPELVSELTSALEDLDNFIADHDGELDPDKTGSIQDWMDARWDDLGEGDVAPHGTSEEYRGYIQLAQEFLEQLRESLIDFTKLPVDLTSFIVNPDYEEGNGGWSTQPAVDYGAAEHYNMTFDHNQTIKLPKDGYYLLTVRAFDRIGGATNDWSIFSNGTYADNVQAAMYAKVGDAIYEHHICQPSKHAVTQAGEADWAPTQTAPGPWAQGAEGVDIYLPNNMNIADLMFTWYRTDESNLRENTEGEMEVIDQTAGYFYNQLFFKAQKGDATIGLSKTKNVGSSWCIWDDWKLWYLGEEVPVGINDIQNSNLVAAPVQQSIYTLGGAKVQKLQRGFNIVRSVDGEGNVKVQKIFVK